MEELAEGRWIGFAVDARVAMIQWAHSPTKVGFVVGKM